MLSNVRRGVAGGLAALAMTLPTSSAMAAWSDLNLPVGVTPISRDVYDLHMLILWICVVIGIIVFGAMLVSIVLHRKAAGHEPAQFHHSTLAEIVWTVIPIVILVGLAIPATRTLIDMEDTSEADLTLKVTAY
jgi:cytochrome c oxidase subunit 2